MPAGPVPTMSTSTSSGSSSGRSMPGARRGLHARVAGDVAVVVELHGSILLRTSVSRLGADRASQRLAAAFDALSIVYDFDDTTQERGSS